MFSLFPFSSIIYKSLPWLFFVVIVCRRCRFDSEYHRNGGGFVRFIFWRTFYSPLPYNFPFVQNNRRIKERSNSKKIFSLKIQYFDFSCWSLVSISLITQLKYDVMLILFPAQIELNMSFKLM